VLQTRLPDEASSLTNLRAADLSRNQLAGLPSWVPDAWAGTLQTMDLSHNCLGHGAGDGSLDALAGLENLTSLSLQRNKLRVLPAVLAALAKMEMLDLSQNEISTLADARGALLSDAWVSLLPSWPLVRPARPLPDCRQALGSAYCLLCTDESSKRRR
jgi:Leucine-rich repeat (LRR) protein